jgi:DNA-binding LacI/PurR family transcriptional regulator
VVRLLVRTLVEPDAPAERVLLAPTLVVRATTAHPDREPDPT